MCFVSFCASRLELLSVFHCIFCPFEDVFEDPGLDKLKALIKFRLFYRIVILLLEVL